MNKKKWIYLSLILFATVSLASSYRTTITNLSDLTSIGKSTDNGIGLTVYRSNITVSSGTWIGTTQALGLTFTGTSIYTTSAKVGIGTSSPALMQLCVNGGEHITGATTSVLTGSIDPTASTAVVGVGTLFTTELIVGDFIIVSGETRKVVAIADNTNLTVRTAFSNNANDTSPDRLPCIIMARDYNNIERFVVSYDGSQTIRMAGTLKDITDFITLTNTTNAADMDVTGTGILFRGYYYDVTTPAVVSLGRVYTNTTRDMTSTASTQDGNIYLDIAVDGVLTNYMSLRGANEDINLLKSTKFGAMYGGSSQGIVTIVAQAETFAISRNNTLVTGVAGGDSITTITGAVAVGDYNFLCTNNLVCFINNNTGAANTIDLEGSTDLTSAARLMLCLYWDGTSWHEKSRSAN